MILTKIPKNVRLWLLALLLFFLAFGFTAYRLHEAPDLFADEILYTRAGTRIAAEGRLVWDTGRPLVVHPPLYFLLESFYLQLTSTPSAELYRVDNIFASVYHARILNSLLAGVTAATLFWLGTRLRDWRLGLLLALLFLLDPFGLRTNRRAMLETLAGLLTLAGMGGLLIGMGPRGALSPRRGIAAGALLGAALITKDLAITSVFTLGLFGLWQWWRYRKQSRHDLPVSYAPYYLAAVVASLTAVTVPLWAVLVDHWDRFFRVKLLALQRLLGLVQLSGWNRPGISLSQLLLERLSEYGSTYILLGLGALATLFLLLFWRRSAQGRFLGLWGLVLYPFYGFVAIFGSGNDQFFYYLLLPALVIFGYAVSVFPQAAPAWMQLSPRARRGGLALLMIGLLAYNGVRWVSSYGVGRDNGYRQLAAYVNAAVPTGATVNASGDRLKFLYFFPDRPVDDAATPAEAREAGIHYFVYAPKDVAARYGRITPELATWLEENGTRLFAVSGNSYGPIYLYHVDYPDAAPANSQAAPRVFAPAEGAPIFPFVVILAAWTVMLIGLWSLSPRASWTFPAVLETNRRHA